MTKATYVSVWDSGSSKIETDCLFNNKEKYGFSINKYIVTLTN